MDLESTLIRAESLFRRFQRIVEAVDKNKNFPAPRLQSGQQQQGQPSKGKAAEEGPAKDRVITPELRKLLSRDVEVLPRKTVAQKGDGMPGAK
jgi:hypothetical protein